MQRSCLNKLFTTIVVLFICYIELGAADSKCTTPIECPEEEERCCHDDFCCVAQYIVKCKSNYHQNESSLCCPDGRCCMKKVEEDDPQLWDLIAVLTSSRFTELLIKNFTQRLSSLQDEVVLARDSSQSNLIIVLARELRASLDSLEGDLDVSAEFSDPVKTKTKKMVVHKFTTVFISRIFEFNSTNIAVLATESVKDGIEHLKSGQFETEDAEVRYEGVWKEKEDLRRRDAEVFYGVAFSVLFLLCFVGLIRHILICRRARKNNVKYLEDGTVKQPLTYSNLPTAPQAKHQLSFSPNDLPKTYV